MALELGHVVGDRDPVGRLRRQQVVPARPGSPSGRQNGCVGVQGRIVDLIRNRRKDLTLFVRRVGQHPQRLIAVGGDDDLVEPLATLVGRNLDRIVEAAHRAHRRSQPDPVAEGRDELLDIGAGAALDDAPGVMTVDAQQAVVVEKAEQEAGGDRFHTLRIGRPDGSGHRHQVVLDETSRVTAAAEELANRLRAESAS